MSTLKEVISDIRTFLYGGFATLPLTIAGTLLVLGLMTANYAMLFLLVGLIIVTPLLSALLNVSLNSLLPMLGLSNFFTLSSSSESCNIVIPYYSSKQSVTTINSQVISPWLSIVSFFFSYLLFNGIELINRPEISESITISSSSKPDTNTVENKINNRKNQALISIISIIAIGLSIIIYRLVMTGCETKTCGVITILAFSSLGYGWFKLLSSVGQDRLSDIFGIANRLLAPSALKNGPIACIPVRA